MVAGRTGLSSIAIFFSSPFSLTGLRCSFMAALALTCVAGPAISDTGIDFSGEPEAKSHDTVWFEFQTDTMAGGIYDTDKRSFWVEVRNDRGKALHVIWHIAWYDQWVLPSLTKPDSRDQTVGTDRSTDVFPSCLSYGNRGSDYVITPIMGTAWEKKESARQVDKDCAGLKGLTTPVFSPEEVQKVSFTPVERDYEILFPSSLADPDSTMLVFRANYGLYPEGSSAYAVNLGYEVDRVEGYKNGDPSSMTVTIFQASEEDDLVQTAMKSSFPDGLEMQLAGDDWPEEEPANGKFSFFVKGNEETIWQMGKLGFAFKTENGEDVATLYVPFYSPIQQ